MLEWATPLWLLALPAALAAPWISRRPRLAFSAFSLIGSRKTIRQRLAALPTLLGSLGLALVVVALARPQLVNRQTVVERDGIDIMLALDTSGSMETPDYSLGGQEASRLAVASAVIAQFAQARPEDRLGLVVFGEEAFTAVPLTHDHRGLADYLRQVQIGIAGQKTTAVGDGLAVAARRLAALEAPSRVVILVTDGRSNSGQIEPLAAADAAAALGVRVYTVGVGSAEGRRGGILGMFLGRTEGPDEETLQAIADRTGGRYFRAADTAALREVYATIDQMEKTTAEVREVVHREERFQPWLIAGLILLSLQVLLGETLLRRLP